MIKEEAIAVLESDVEYLYSQDSPYCRQAYQMAIEALKSEPTKQGRWIVLHGVLAGDDIYGDMGECSNCGLHLRDWEWNYCPNCGARMDAQIGEDKSHPFAESVMMGMDEVEE